MFAKFLSNQKRSLFNLLKTIALVMPPKVSAKGEVEMKKEKCKCCVNMLASLVSSLRVLVDDFQASAVKANQLNLDTAICFLLPFFSSCSIYKLDALLKC